MYILGNIYVYFRYFNPLLKVHQVISPIYHFHTSELDNIFMEKRNKIFSTKNLFAIFD